jgi:hypothetical protein
MNLVQEKVKQRNITPNFLRFRSTSHPIQERAQLALSARRLARTTKYKPKSLLNAPSAVLPVPVAVPSRLTNVASSTSASSVPPLSSRTADQPSWEHWGWNRRAASAQEPHNAGRISPQYPGGQLPRQTLSHLAQPHPPRSCQQQLPAEDGQR